MPYLESLRISIANYTLASRGRERRQSLRENEDRRSGTGDGLERSGAGKSALEAKMATLSVTVSIGVAERNRRLHTPAKVLRAADEALYRAKDAGRNRLSR